MKKYSKLFTVISLMLVFAMMLSACGGVTATPTVTPSVEPTVGVTSSPEPTQTPTPSPTPTPTPRPSSEGKLVYSFITDTAWDMNDHTTWGEPSIRIDKDSENAVLQNHEGTAEDVWMDIYTAFDDTYLYVGIVSPDEDVTGSENYWAGDGMQFRLSAGKKMNMNSFLDICVTANNSGAAQFGTNVPEIANNCLYGFTSKDGHIYAAAAIKIEDIGLERTANEVAFNIIRVSGTRTAGYAGWLAYGALWGSPSSNTPGLTENNVIELYERPAPPLVGNATTLLSQKTETEWNVEDESTWGDAVIHIDKDSENAALFNYNDTLGDIYMDIYTGWDAEYLYFGFVSEDSYIKGSSSYYEGDGIQMEISAGEKINANSAFNICLTLNNSKKPVLELQESMREFKDNFKYGYNVKEDKLYMSIGIRLEDLGITGEVYNGTPVSFNMIRIEGTRKHAYAGWLAYGPMFGVDHSYNPGCKITNRVLLAGGPEKPADDVVVPDDPLDEVLASVYGLSDRKVYETGSDFIFGDSYAKKIITTETGTYVLYITFADIMAGGKDKTALNEFSLLKLEGKDKLRELGYGYVYNGIPDVLVDKDGNIYVVGGGTSWDMDKYSDKYDYKDRPEKAVANIWFYDPVADGISGTGLHKVFNTQTEGYRHAGSVIDEEAGKIYIVYLGKNTEGKYNNLEYFTYDIASKAWSEDIVSYPVNDVNSIATYAAVGGIGVIYSNSEGIHFIDPLGEETTSLAGTLLDTFEDKDGNVDILYSVMGNNVVYATLKADGTLTEGKTVGIETDKYAVNVTSNGGKKYIVGLDKGVSIGAVVYAVAEDGNVELVKEIDFKSDVTYRSAFMVAADESGTANELTLFFAGYDGNTFDWFMTQIKLD